MSRKPLRLLTLMTLIGIIPVTTWVFSAGVQSQQKKSHKDAEDIGHILRQKTLREAAQERDIEITASSELAEYGDLPLMVQSAHTIVIGRINAAESAFSHSGNDIQTTYAVDVQRVLKVTAPIEFPVRFECHGGTVFTNGHKATIKVKRFEKLRTGQDYILFLEWTQGRYILAGGLSGVFVVEDNSRVYSLASAKENKIKVKYDGVNLDAVINEVLALQ